MLPLAGQLCPLLVSEDRQPPRESTHAIALRRLLEGDASDGGWSLVVLDPLSRFAGCDTESDNVAATRFIRVLETFTGVHGKPTVLVSHHSSKMARRTGSVDARGVTGLTDGGRWAATMRMDGSDVLFKQSKSNYSKPMIESVRLVRDVGGALRIASADEIAARHEKRRQMKEEREEAKIRELEDLLVDALRDSPQPVRRRADVVQLVSGTSTLVEAAFTRAKDAGRIRKSKASRKGDQPFYEAVR